MNNKVTQKILPTPTKERLHELFTYSFVEGALYWKIYDTPKRAGNHPKPKKYCTVKIGYSTYQRHRLIWAFFYGDPGPWIVDHINKSRNDDRIENLRIADFSKNRCNAKMSRTNTSGFKGVMLIVRNNKLAKPYVRWRARIHMNHQCVNLGTYSTKEEAAAAYAEAANRLHGEFVGHLQ
jgi:hypothetical protein